MADSARGSLDVEILVHVAAHASAADDAMYRQLAQAYLDFEPDSAHRSFFALEEGPYSSSGHDTHDSTSPVIRVDDAPSSPPLSRSQSQPDSDRTSPAQPGDIIFESEELSFQSVVDNRSSPRLKSLGRPVANGSSPLVSRPADASQSKRWQTPPSQISDSYPMPSTSSLYASPTRVLQQSLGLLATSPSNSPHDLPPSSLSKQVPSSLDSPSSRRSSCRLQLGQEVEVQQIDVSPPHSPAVSAKLIGGKAAQKIIPVTPSAPRALETTSEHEGRQPALDFTHISSTDSSLPVIPSSSRGESEPPPAKRLKTFCDSTAQIRHDAAALIRSASDLGPGSSPFSSTLKSEQLSALEVFAPSPPVGVGSLNPSSMIPGNLAKLADKLSSRYRPTVLRDLSLLE